MKENKCFICNESNHFSKDYLWVHPNSWHPTPSMRQCLNRWWMMFHLLGYSAICREPTVVGHVRASYIWYDIVVQWYQHWSISEKWWNILFSFWLIDWSIRFTWSFSQFVSSNPVFFFSSVWLVRSTHSTEFSLTRLVSITIFNVVNDLVLVIEFAELSSSLIHLTSMISRRS